MRRLWRVTILIVAASTSRAQERAKGPEYYNPTWSPDSRSIAFESTRDGKSAVYTVTLDGTLKRLTAATASDFQPSWSPDGQRIVFVSDRNGHAEMFVMNVDGSDQRVLTTSPSDRQHYVPVYSRDGSVIMFAFHDKHRGNLYGVGVVRADGGDMRWLSDSTVSSEEPKWSDDGEWVLFEQVPTIEPRQGETPREEMQRRQRLKQYFAIHPDGTGRTRMAGDTHVNDGSVSRDGRWSVRSKSGADGGIFITERTTKQERQLVSRTSVSR